MIETPEALVAGVLELYQTPHIADHWHLDAAALIAAYTERVRQDERERMNRDIWFECSGMYGGVTITRFERRDGKVYSRWTNRGQWSEETEANQ